jgi:hypothetical protein
MHRPSGNLSDEELLTQLSAAFPAEKIEPDAASLHRLSLAVAELHPGDVAEAPARVSKRRRPHRLTLPGRLSPVVSAGTLVGALVMGTGISYAVGVPIPAAVRSVARTVGLASPTPKVLTLSPLDAAQQAESTLHQALADSNSSSSEISHDTSELARTLAQVRGDHTPGAERVSDDGHHLLVEACRQVGGSLQPNATDGGREGTSGGDSSNGGPCGSAGGDGPRSSGSSPGGPSTGTATTAPSGGGGNGDGGGHTDHGTDGGANGGGDGSSTSPGAPSGGSSGGSSAGSTGGGSNQGSTGPSTSGQSGSGPSTSGAQPTSGGPSSGQSSPSDQPSDSGSGGDPDSSSDGSSGGKG